MVDWKREKKNEKDKQFPALATSLWGLLYADEARGQSRLAIGQEAEEDDGRDGGCLRGIWPRVSEAKTEIMCLRTKGMPESTAIFSVEAASQVYN